MLLKADTFVECHNQTSQTDGGARIKEEKQYKGKEIAMDLHLEEQEASLAFKILKNRLGELRTEVRHNKDSLTRDYLKHKERILNKILEKFSDVDLEAHRKGLFKNEKKA